MRYSKNYELRTHLINAIKNSGVLKPGQYEALLKLNKEIEHAARVRNLDQVIDKTNKFCRLLLQIDLP